MRIVCTCAILLALACSAPAQQAPAAQTGSDVVAQVGGRTITLKELDERWQRDEPAGHADAVQRLYEGRKATLDALVGEILIERAAKAKSVDTKQFSESEIARRLTPVTDERVAAFFRENQAQMQGRDLAAMGPTIRRYLEEQGRNIAYQAFLSDLRKADASVRVILDAPRREVEVAADDAVLGSSNAAVTLVEFSDFQCPFCGRIMPTLKRVREKYGDQVRIVWKDFPLTSIHPDAMGAAQAGQCAREQKKFWEYHDRLFTNQQALDPNSLKKYAADVGLDTAAFNACLDMAKYGARVEEQMAAGSRLGVSSTPSIFINGRMVTGAQPYEVFTAIIDEELERVKTK
jgi:protein-disulfide isomerase